MKRNENLLRKYVFEIIKEFNDFEKDYIKDTCYKNHVDRINIKNKYLNNPKEIDDEVLNTLKRNPLKSKSILDKAIDYDNYDVLRTPAQKRPQKHT